MIFGTIPEEIVIVSSVEQPVYRAWDGLPDDMDVEKEMVIPAFVCERNSAKTLATAVHWAESARSFYDRDLKRNVKKADPVVQEVRKNDPQKNLRVAALDVRGNGGRAYKIVGPDNYYYDLREDVMLDTMIQSGIRKGGFLDGEFIWAKLPGGMKLIRVGSKLHERLIECTGRSKQKRIGAKELIPGGIYADKKGYKHAYVGRVNCSDYDYHSDGGYGYYNSNPKFELYKRDIQNAYLFVHVDDRDESFQASFEKHLTSSWAKITSSHQYIEMVDQISIDPEDVVMKIRQRNEKSVRDALARQVANRNSYGYNNHYQYRDVCYYSKEATVSLVGSDVAIMQEIQDLDKFVVERPAKK